MVAGGVLTSAGRRPGLGGRLGRLAGGMVDQVRAARDADLRAGRTVEQPFAWTDETGAGRATPDGADLRRARVVQCALSRICGVCAEPLGRPIAFLGTATEAERLIFHGPPLHRSCAEALHAAADHGEEWHLHTAPGFEFVRPAKHDLDPHPRFDPHP